MERHEVRPVQNLDEPCGVSYSLSMKNFAIPCVLAIGVASGCASRTPPAETKQPTLRYIQVQNPAQEMCRDDTLSSTERFNVPFAVFSAGTVS